MNDYLRASRVVDVGYGPGRTAVCCAKHKACDAYTCQHRVSEYMHVAPQERDIKPWQSPPALIKSPISPECTIPDQLMRTGGSGLRLGSAIFLTSPLQNLRGNGSASPEPKLYWQPRGLRREPVPPCACDVCTRWEGMG